MKSKKIVQNEDIKKQVNSNSNETVKKQSFDYEFNKNAKSYKPKNLIEDININQYKNNNKNPEVKKEQIEKLLQEEYDSDDEDNDFEDIEEELIMKEMLQAENDYDSESDADKWFPDFKDCDCCKGYVYLCNGETCNEMGQCYCKMKADLDEKMN